MLLLLPEVPAEMLVPAACRAMDGRRDTYTLSVNEVANGYRAIRAAQVDLERLSHCRFCEVYKQAPDIYSPCPFHRKKEYGQRPAPVHFEPDGKPPALCGEKGSDLYTGDSTKVSCTNCLAVLADVRT